MSTRKSYRYVTGPSPRKEIWLLYGVPRYNERVSVTIPLGYFWKIMLECGHTYLVPSSRRFAEMRDGSHTMGGLSEYISDHTRREPPELEQDWIYCQRCAPVTKVEVKPEQTKHRHFSTCSECKVRTCCYSHKKSCIVSLREQVRDAVIEYDYDSAFLTTTFDKLLDMLTREQLEEVLK